MGGRVAGLEGERKSWSIDQSVESAWARVFSLTSIRDEWDTYFILEALI